MFRPIVPNSLEISVSDIEDDGQIGHMVSILVAKEDETTRQVFVDCKLAYVYEAEFWEFSYTVTVIALDGSYEDFATQDSRMAHSYIPKKARRAVLELVRDAMLALVSLAKPDLIFRVTWGQNLPEKAMRKYHFLTKALLGSGYRIRETGTDPLGRTFWLFELAD